MSVYTAGRDPDFFPNPLAFQPDRWHKTSDGRHAGVSRAHASIPFAIGARSCIGRKIAMAQMRHSATKIIRGFRLHSLNCGPVEDIMQMVVRPKQTIRISVQPREHC